MGRIALSTDVYVLGRLNEGHVGSHLRLKISTHPNPASWSLDLTSSIFLIIIQCFVAWGKGGTFHIRNPLVSKLGALQGPRFL